MDYTQIIHHPYFLPGLAVFFWLYLVLIWRNGWWRIGSRMIISLLIGAGIWYEGSQLYDQRYHQEVPQSYWIGLGALTLTLILFKPIRLSGSGRGRGRGRGRGGWRRERDEDREKEKRTRWRQGAGYVYVISNPAHKDGILKIGMTEQDDYMTRIKQLYNTSAPMPFDIHLIVKTNDPRGLEKELHHIFEDDRVNNNREFFNVTPKEVLRKMPNIGNAKVIEKNF